MRVVQIERGLENGKLHRGRKRKCESGSGKDDWSLEDDKALIRLVWSGARGEARQLPGRTARACTDRLQKIHKHVPKVWTHLHMKAPDITSIASHIMADTEWFEYIAAERQRLSQLKEDDALDATGPDFLGSDEQPGSTPSPKSAVIDSKLDDYTRRLLDACHAVSMSPADATAHALDVCSTVVRYANEPAGADVSVMPTVAADDASLKQLLSCAVRRLCAAVHEFNMTVAADFMASYRLQASAIELKCQIDRAIKNTSLEHDEALRLAIFRLHDPAQRSHVHMQKYKWTQQQDFHLVMEIQRVQRAGTSPAARPARRSFRMTCLQAVLPKLRLPHPYCGR